MNDFPLRFPAVKVKQPLGEFYAVSIPASVLLATTFMDPTRIESVNRKGFLYTLLGNQREASIPRAKSIAKYINTVESAFPNSIILAANYINHGEFQLDENQRWRLDTANEKCELIIPTDSKMASIIDGQHRLLGFNYCEPDRRGMELLCSVYMDLPESYQAYLFATININQRKVDKSLAYEQFGYNLDEEDKKSWAPDKCAVFLTRRLNLDPDSPLCKRIKIAPLDSELVFRNSDLTSWNVSTACIVEGIIPLISTKASRDRDDLHKVNLSDRRRSGLANDSAPLRSLYLSCEDEALYALLKGYFKMCNELIWKRVSGRSYITKTIGIQGQFDVLKRLAQDEGADGVIKRAWEVLTKSQYVDFDDSFFQGLGKGRTRVRNTIFLLGNIIQLADIPEPERAEYRRICDPDDLLARSIHESYLQSRIQSTGMTTLADVTLRSWDDLPEDLRESSRKEADHIFIKIGALGCEIVPNKDPRPALTAFSHQEVELLAQLEHERWVSERRKAGWVYGPRKDTERKVNPNLIPWDNLAESIKEYERSMVIAIPKVLARTGMKIVRRADS